MEFVRVYSYSILLGSLVPLSLAYCTCVADHREHVIDLYEYSVT